MVKIKPMDEIKAKYTEAAAVVPARYSRAIERVTDWQSKSLEGQALYEEKMSDPTVQARRAKAIGNVSNEEWKNRVRSLGTGRIGEGMKKSVEKQAKGFAPYHAAISGLELPARVSDPMANVDNRLKAVVGVLVDKKKEILG